MKKERAARPLAAAALSLLLLPLAPAGPRAFAQRTGGPVRSDKPPNMGTTPEGTRPAGIRARSTVMLDMEREAGRTAPTPEQVRLALEQIAEDYERIQVVNNRMMGAAVPAPEPDYGLVAEATAEIRKRAERLRTNLALPKPGDEPKKRPASEPAVDAAHLKKALLRLDRSVMRFVKSPLFQNTSVVDAEAAVEARRDLDDVIELSGHIIKDAERLGKKPAKR